MELTIPARNQTKKKICLFGFSTQDGPVIISLQGMKKHKLLREDILPAMASNRKVQRLLNEFMDLLSEYEINDTTNSDSKSPVQPAITAQTTDSIDQQEPAARLLDQMEPNPRATDQTNHVPQENDQEKLVPKVSADQVNQDPPANDTGEGITENSTVEHMGSLSQS